MIGVRVAVCGGTALLLALSVAGSAGAETYRLGASTQESLLAIDTDSFRRDGDIVSFDSLLFSSRMVTVGGKPSWAARFASEINCRTNERRALTITHLAKDGRPIITEQANEEWTAVPQGGVGETMRNLICDGLVTEAAVPFGGSFVEAEKMARATLEP